MRPLAARPRPRFDLLRWLFSPLDGGASLPELVLLIAWMSALIFVAPMIVYLRYLWMALLLAMAAVHWRAWTPLLLRWAPIMLIPVWMLLSCVWSARPRSGLLYSAVVFVTLFLCLYVGARFTWRQFLLAALLVLGAAAVMSLAHPNTKAVYADAQQAALGIFAQKNVLGKRMMTLSVLGLGIVLGPRFPLWQRGAAAFLLLVGLLLVGLSRSTTALVLTGLGIMLTVGLTVVWSALRRVRGARLLIFVLGFIALVAATAFLSTYDDPLNDLLGVFGKSSDLTGRTVLWSQGLAYLNAHPWGGAGMEGFWRPGSSDALQIASQFIKTEGAYQFNFQNSFVEYGVHLGYPGLALFILALAIGCWMVVSDFIRYQDHRAGILMILALLVVMRTFTESEMFREFEFNILIFWTVVAFSMKRRIEYRRQPGSTE